MELRKVTAIFDEMRLKTVESTLIAHGVSGFTLHPVKGRGRYFDCFNDNHLIKHVQMEIYSKDEDARQIARLIIDAAHVNADSEGLVSITPIMDLFWIHDRCSVTANDFHYHGVKHG